MAGKIPHFALPFRIVGARGAIINEQDSEAEIMDCVDTILRYNQGHRPEKLEFGIPDQTFESPVVDGRRIQEALNEWEPRVEMIVGQSVVDLVDNLIQKITVERGKGETT